MIKGIMFDLNGTLIDILTDEWEENTYRVTANYLAYHGVYVSRESLRDLYFALNKQQRRESPEEHPEFDIVSLFRKIITRFQDKAAWSGRMPGRTHLAERAAEVFRAASRYRLELYPGVLEVMESLKGRYRMLALSDGQPIWAIPEMNSLGLGGYFEKVLVSGMFGYRKPDRRLFEMGLDFFQLKPEEVIFVGNDMYRDVYGAKNAGMRAVFFRSNQGNHEFRDYEPDYIIYNFGELPDALQFLSRH